MHFADSFPGLAPAGDDALGHFRMLKQETQELAGRVAGAAYYGNFH
jgi:hypothetical protein